MYCAKVISLLASGFDPGHTTVGGSRVLSTRVLTRGLGRNCAFPTVPTPLCALGWTGLDYNRLQVAS